MKLAKLFFLSLTFLMFLFSNLFSQPKEIIELLNRNNHHSIPHGLEELDKMHSKDSFVNNSLFHKLPKTNLETFDVVDSVIVMDSDGSLGKYTYTHNTNGNMTSEIYETWDGANWMNNTRTTATYDTNGNMSLVLYENWDGTNWVNSGRETYTYDSNGNRTSVLYESWDGANWVNFWRETYTYDSNGNMTSDLYENWDGADWVND